MSRTYVVTGGAGFIGSNFVHHLIDHTDHTATVLDKLTYAGNPANLQSLTADARHLFVQGDVCDQALLDELLQAHRPRAIVHFAAESHVDRSIHEAADFIDTNIVGTYRLLEAARRHWSALPDHEQARFRFVHVSTDEVYGSLAPDAPAVVEGHRYAPSSPYSASKATADHLTHAWHRTYGLPVLTTHGSNNYGPRQFPEKLVPLFILNALAGEPLPLYGDGQQVRDWLYVGDHCSAIRRILQRGVPGETYNIGGGNEKTNLQIAERVCALLDTLRPRSSGRSYAQLLVHVQDRPGHDRRYAIDASKLANALDWRPAETLETGMRKTVQWYLDHPDWIASVQSGAYRDWMSAHYGAATTGANP